MNSDGNIEGGFILLSRRLLKSALMEKPPLYLKLWVWLLLQASHTEHGGLKRGQLFTSYERMREAMKYRVGASFRTPSKKEVRGAVDFLTKERAIDRTKVTHGLVITILNYSFYQDWENYKGHTQGHSAGNGEGTIITKNENKKGNTSSDISERIIKLKTKYTTPDLIDRAFQALASTRKSGKIADSILLACLEKWEAFPAPQVEAAIRTYLEKGYASEGKDEKYLLGIIRNAKSNIKKAPTVPEWY